MNADPKHTPTPQAASRFGWKKTLVYSLVPAIVLLLAFEGAARLIEVWWPPMQIDLGLGFMPESRAFVPGPTDPGVLVTHPDKVDIVFPPQRFSREKPPNTLRIAAVGGSSVHYLKDFFPEMEARLEERLAGQFDNVEIINAGGHAYGSDRAALVVAEVLHYDPSLLMLYTGHNEFEELEQRTMTDLDTLPLQRLLGHAALYRVLRDTFARVHLAWLRQRHAHVTNAGEAKPWRLDLTAEEKAARMNTYEKNLRHILRLCREADVPVVMGALATNYWKPRLAEEETARKYEAVYEHFAAGRYAEGLALGREILRSADRRQASDIENNIVRALAREHNNASLVDVEAAVAAAEPHGVPGETLLRDECHLNEDGNAILIRLFEDAIAAHFARPAE
ncbi:MAG: SGNH/GDSL hydrolase family protein [Candidatus Hydrogenedentota bacterium]